MLAAVGGVLFTLATVLKLQGYSAYVQPMPIVVAAMRWGPAAGRKAMTATCFLLLGKLLACQAPLHAWNHGSCAQAVPIMAAAMCRGPAAGREIMKATWPPLLGEPLPFCKCHHGGQAELLCLSCPDQRPK